MAELQSYKGGYYLWQYVPSLAGAVIFILLFLILTFLHFWRLWKNRAWYCSPFAIGCLFEFVGYTARAIAVNKTGMLTPYLIQSCFILLAPLLFAASIYMTLGQIIRCVQGEQYSVIRINWLTKEFVLGDVLSLLVQGGALGLLFNIKTIRLGEYIVVAGLCIQVTSFGLFFLSAVIFQRRLNKNPTRESIISPVPWKQCLYMLDTVSVLIFARSIFRVLEYLQGQNGYTLQHEWTVYAFDTVPMFIVAVIFFAYDPSKMTASKEGLDGPTNIVLDLA